MGNAAPGSSVVCLATVKRPIHLSQDTGSRGFAGPLEHVAASEFSGHSDLLVASAAKETEYMRDSAAASVAAFVLDGHTDLLLTPAANVFHYMECQNVKQTLQGAATAAAILVKESFCCHCLSEWCWFATGFWDTLKKTCLHFSAREETRMHIQT